MERVYNFAAGPSTMPVEALETAAREMLSFGESGMCVMEMSHRSKVYQEIFSETEARIRRISSLYSSGIRAYSKRAANAEVVSETVAIGVNGGLIILIFAIYSMTNICAMTAERIRSHIRTWGVLRAAGVRPHTAAVTHLGETAFTFILGCAPGAGLFYGLIGSEVLVGEGINPLFVLLYAAAMILAAYICIRVTVNRFWSIPVRRMLIG